MLNEKTILELKIEIANLKKQKTSEDYFDKKIQDLMMDLDESNNLTKEMVETREISKLNIKPIIQLA